MEQQTQTGPLALPPEQTTQAASKRVPQQGTDERRAYNRDAKKRSRAKQKQEREAKERLTSREHCDAFFASRDYVRMSEYRKETAKKISEELETDLNAQATEVVDFILSASFGFENKIMRQVTDPPGLMVGSLFPDVIGRHIVAGAHKYGLERSATFSKVYRDLLRTLDQRFGKQLSKDPIEMQAALDIKSELVGEYAMESVT